MKINSRKENEIMAEEFKKGIAIQRFARRHGAKKLYSVT